VYVLSGVSIDKILLQSNNSRRVFLPYFSKLACEASVCCCIAFRPHLQLYPISVRKPDVCRDSLGTPRSDESAVRLNTPNQVVRQLVWIWQSRL
jgi:hypothetical protein